MQTFILCFTLNFHVIFLFVQFLLAAPARDPDEELSEAEEDHLDAAAFDALLLWLKAIQVHPREARLATGKTLFDQGLSRPNELFIYFRSTGRDSANAELKLPAGHMMALYRATPYLDASLHEL